MITLQHDRDVEISTGRSRKDVKWQPQIMNLSALYTRLESPLRGAETLSEYLSLPKGAQDDKKDCGGFVAGKLSGGHRKKNAVISREIVTLDLDTVKAYDTDAVLEKIRSLSCGFCVYSTRKHVPTKPRLRVLIPLDRAVSPDEYEAIARKIAEHIGIEMCDPSTFEAHRLMYWASCCKDTDYVFDYADAPMIKADTVLSSYSDWHNQAQWPQVPGYAKVEQSLAVKQGDPETKPGLVGIFNRAYDIQSAMDKFIPGVYSQCANDTDRYTYLAGSTTGGAVLYNNGKFLYSHHATDPCGGKLVNAFDLVRLHLFGDRDDDVKESCPVNQLPSFKAMCEHIKDDKTVASVIAQERAQEAFKEYQAMSLDGNTNDCTDESGGVGDTGDFSFVAKLETNKKTGQNKSTINNILMILDNDPRLKDKFKLNQFAGRGEIRGKLPWASKTNRRLWSDTDSNGLYWFLETTYGINNRSAVDSALDLHASKHAFNEVTDFLLSLKWDGTPRLDTLLIDYLGADDTEYVRSVTRKAFCAAVSRAITPGSKYDNMLILCGPQGCGKSTILDKMSKGWFNDSIRTFEGKEASELLQGVWIVEVAELDAFRRSDVARIKQFLSLRADRYRAAYGRNVSELPRRCVFFGTCNVMDFLQDTTGNRRFWPVDVHPHNRKAAPWELDDETISQIWAEAVVRWKLGEPLYLTGDIEDEAKKTQERHREYDVSEGTIEEFLSKPIPKDWDTWPVDRRCDYWAGNYKGTDIELVERESVCVLEIWCEAEGGRAKDCDRTQSRRINAVLDRLPDWQRTDSPQNHGPYKRQRGFVRIKKND